MVMSNFFINCRLVIRCRMHTLRDTKSMTLPTRMGVQNNQVDCAKQDFHSGNKLAYYSFCDCDTIIPSPRSSLVSILAGELLSSAVARVLCDYTFLSNVDSCFFTIL